MTAGAAAGGHEIYQADKELLVSLKGRVVLEDLAQLKTSILPRIVRGIESVYVDLKRVDYVDSAGLGLLIGFKMQAKSQGAGISLLDPNRTVSDVLAISRIDGIFEILSGRDAAEIRDRIAVDSNLRGKSAEGGSAAGNLPQVNVDGTFQAEEDGNQVREAVEEHCRTAVEAMRQGNYEQSIESYKSALELDPDYLPALNNLAIVYEKQPVWHDMARDIWRRVLDVSRARNDAKHMDRADRHLADLG